MKINIDNIKESILADAKANDFSGYDPFDGLNSTLFELFPKLKSGLFGLAWTQFFKISPVNFRALLGVPKRRNPKGVALFILGLLEDYKRSAKDDHIKQAIELADWLITQQCDKKIWGSSCWGYHFDWKAWAFFVPKGKPNAITTVYVARALFSLAEMIEDQNYPNGVGLYRSAALSAADFIVDTLYSEIDGRVFFAYVPGEKAFVHNASLWAAAWVSVVATYSDNSKYRLLSLKVAYQSADEQGRNGQWYYGAMPHHQFIDGFHTGYNLEALDMIRRSLNVHDFDDVIEKGCNYYKANFFDKNYTAKYYNDNLYPLDMHSVSQAILILTKLSCDKAANDFLVKKIIQRAVETLFIPSENRFSYQRNKYMNNSINYMRWTQAWAYYSFSAFLNYSEIERDE